jgi:hypothetical protein
MIEVLVTIDTGTSLLLDLTVRDDFTAETALLAMAEIVQRHGLPHMIRIARRTKASSNASTAPWRKNVCSGCSRPTWARPATR